MNFLKYMPGVWTQMSSFPFVPSEIHLADSSAFGQVILAMSFWDLPFYLW